MAYDIFISYRREGGYETAKHLFDLLSRDGYKVSFDIDTLRNGDFDVELLKRVEECTDFVLILNEGAFDRTVDPYFDPQKDWLRQELAHALKLGKNIIPIMLNGFTEFPDNLPADVARVQKKNGPKYDQYYFDGFYNKLVDVFLKTPKPRKTVTIQRVMLFVMMAIIILLLGYLAIPHKDETNTEDKIKVETIPEKEETSSKNTKQVVASKNQEKKDTSTQKQSETKSSVSSQNATTTSTPKVEQKSAQTTTAKKTDATETKKDNSYLLNLPDDAFVSFKENGKYGYKLKSTGEIIIPSKYDYAWSFGEGLAMVELNDKRGFIDKTGTEVIPLKYDGAAFFAEGFARVELNGKCGFIDKTGKEITLFKYGIAYPFIEGLAMVALNRKYGFIDKTGKEVIPLKYNYAWPFSRGLASVKLNNGKWGFIDKTGKEIIPFKYDYANPFREGKAKVKLNNEWFYIDKNGNRVD